MVKLWFDCITIIFFAIKNYRQYFINGLNNKKRVRGVDLINMILEGLIAKEKMACTPFRLATLLIFILAIFHTFIAHHISAWGHQLSLNFSKKQKKNVKKVSFLGEILKFLGEVETVFLIWSFPLILAISYFHSWDTAIDYINTRVYIEPLFVFVIMVVASTKPIVKIVEGWLWLISQLCGGKVVSWWFAILTIGPLLGSLITEVAAMTISALILVKQFYLYRPTKSLAYATLGLLFVNISVGGLLTNFASPPVLIIARKWNWDSFYMFTHFGWKVVLGIIVCNTIYYLYFRKEFEKLDENKQEEEDVYKPIPYWITLVHFFFLTWIVLSSHYPVFFILAFLIFLAFYQATIHHQDPLYIKRSIFVGVFLAGLIIHGGLQSWWIEPLLRDLSKGMIVLISMILTPFNDNAAIVYLVSLIPDLNEGIKTAVVGSVVAGGGLTVIANAPNPAGQAILHKYFPKGVSPWKLFLSALFPTIIFSFLFYFF
ncbi:MAG: putative Na+/H+ antiporter [Rhabdochlamydiaceae bacterium]